MGHGDKILTDPRQNRMFEDHWCGLRDGPEGSTRSSPPAALSGVPTGRRIATDYVYVAQFEGDKIAHMTKIFNAGLLECGGLLEPTCHGFAGAFQAQRLVGGRLGEPATESYGIGWWRVGGPGRRGRVRQFTSACSNLDGTPQQEDTGLGKSGVNGSHVDLTSGWRELNAFSLPITLRCEQRNDMRQHRKLGGAPGGSDTFCEASATIRSDISLLRVETTWHILSEACEQIPATPLKASAQARGDKRWRTNCSKSGKRLRTLLKHW